MHARHGERGAPAVSPGGHQQGRPRRPRRVRAAVRNRATEPVPTAARATLRPERRWADERLRVRRLPVPVRRQARTRRPHLLRVEALRRRRRRRSDQG